jgi:hypothetical protein
MTEASESTVADTQTRSSTQAQWPKSLMQCQNESTFIAVNGSVNLIHHAAKGNQPEQKHKRRKLDPEKLI